MLYNVYKTTGCWPHPAEFLPAYIWGGAGEPPTLYVEVTVQNPFP